MNRHKQKDEEAGGEGTGTLNTRKRSWKDHDGRIVVKKPIGCTPLDNSSLGAQFVSQVEGPISPPVSSPSDNDPAFANGHSIIPDYSLSAGPFDSPGAGGYWIPPESSQPRAPPYFDINYDEVFQPDTSSSFNMPYTTQINYDWLFSLDNNFSNVPSTSLSPYSSAIQEQALSISLGRANVSSEVRHYDNTTESTLTSMASLDYARTIGSTQHTTSPSVSDGAEFSLLSASRPDYPADRLEAEFERPLATLQPPKRLPSIDEFTYAQILETIKDARPSSPSGSLLDTNHPLLSHSSLQSYCDLFFTRFNTAYPLIHQATFETSRNRNESLLLLSMILLGATYSEKEAHQLAVCIHDVIRPAIFSHTSFNPKPDLWMLQTILLVECFGKSRAGQKQHDMSHLFHGMLINLIRRSDCQSVRPIRPIYGDKANLTDHRSWRQWAEAEEKKRLALLCFMWDTQHAVLFCQSLCMSAFELRLPLPCNQPLWEAPTAEEWSRLSFSNASEPMYLLALKSYITLDSHQFPRLNGFSRVLVFHGLLSIFWDMRRRDQTSLGVISSQGRWQNRLGSAYQAWKMEFDAFCVRQADFTFAETSKGTFPEEAKVELEVWRTAYAAVFYAANVLLHAEFLDIQIFAGARHILGRSVSRTDFVRSEKVVKRWATSHATQDRDSVDDSTDAATAAWHAAKLLQIASQTVDFDSMGLFHVPWCLYLATITIWAFHHTGAKGLTSLEDDSELVWDAKAEMCAIVDSMVEAGIQGLPGVQGLKRTSGLVWVMAEVLGKVRWGIVHASVTVLRGLIPWRLIGRFDDAAP